MSDYDNLYLCPVCDNVGPLKSNSMNCDECGFEGCFVARHINEGTRKFWMRKEAELDDWRFEKRLKTAMKNVAPEDGDLVKVFTKSVKELFKQFIANKHDLEDIFPKFTRDYKRTTGRRETGWKSAKSVTKQKNSSLRGSIYEGAITHFSEVHEFFESISSPIPYFDKQREKYTDYEPDLWFNFNGQQIPVELKTYDKQSMVIPRQKNGIKQSRRYGHLSFMTHNNPNKLSALIVCCPEERTFSCAIVGEKADSMFG